MVGRRTHHRNAPVRCPQPRPAVWCPPWHANLATPVRSSTTYHLLPTTYHPPSTIHHPPSSNGC